ncbi:calcium-binding protein, partial [Sphingosinicella sp. LHD-64]|uniref:calcium-binding protein n=1 Tax=Sphingosinicella sp. LHD-64 TaxID=3072139 RepID=UPI00280E46BB
MPVITGTGGSDTLNGTAEADLIRGLGGSDFLTGGAGNDELQGGDGNDSLQGGEGDDLFFGGAGDDFLAEFSGGANDRMYGEAGNDEIRFSAGPSSSPLNVLLDGGSGDDLIDHSCFTVALSTSVLIGGDGFDRIRSSGGGDVVIDAGQGSDLVTVNLIGDGFGPPHSGPTDFVVTLGQGIDLLVVDSFANYSPPAGTVTITDFAAGGNGDAISLAKFLAFKTNGWAYDANPFLTGHLRLIQRGADAVLQLDSDGAGSGNAFADLVIFQSIDALSLTAQNLGGYAVDGAPAAVEINGTAEQDLRSATGGDDIIRGFGGNDVLLGGAGADLIDGGDGDDEISGELGSDLIYGGNGDDKISDFLDGDDRIYGGEGRDSVFIDRQWLLAPGSNVLIDGGEGNDTLFFFGRSGSFRPETDNATILGGDGDDHISVSGGGSVTIDAGEGSDIVSFGAASVNTSITLGMGADRVHLPGTPGLQVGTIVITDFQSGSGGDELYLLSFLGSLVGGPWNPAVNPFEANYLRLAQSGADTLLLFDASGEGEFYSLLLRLSGVTASTLTQVNLGFAPGVISIAGTAGADFLVGTALHDSLLGFAGDDVLNGGDGSDQLAGGLGNDLLYVDGGDLVFEGAG